MIGDHQQPPPAQPEGSPVQQHLRVCRLSPCKTGFVTCFGADAGSSHVNSLVCCVVMSHGLGMEEVPALWQAVLLTVTVSQ